MKHDHDYDYPGMLSAISIRYLKLSPFFPTYPCSA